MDVGIGALEYNMEGPLKLWGGRVTLGGGGAEAGAILVATEEEACVGSAEEPLASRYAHVCGRMRTYADVC